MKITFERIKEYQERFIKLDHIDMYNVGEFFTHKELKELIDILGNLLYFMYMTNKDYLDSGGGD